MLAGWQSLRYAASSARAPWVLTNGRGAMQEQGMVVIDDAIDGEQLARLRAELNQLLEAGMLSATHQQAVGTRQDKIAWADDQGTLFERGQYPTVREVVLLLKSVAAELQPFGTGAGARLLHRCEFERR